MNAQSQTFASLLRRHRLAAGLSQEELAERAGLSRRGVSDLERGVKRSPHRDTILRLADALGLEGQERSLFAALARGQSSPLSGDRARPPDALPHHSAPFVGRRHELALLDDHRALRTPPLLFVAGEPGIGKSRLLAEAALCAAAQGWRVIAGGCTRRSGQEPYEPFVSALARAVRHTPPARQRMDLQGCGWLVRLLPELLETRVAPAPAWTVPPEQERRLMFDAVARYLANVAGPAGTLLVLDDLQWASVDALNLLAFLGQESAHIWDATSTSNTALRMLGAYRTSETQSGHPLDDLLIALAKDELLSLRRLGRLTDDEARLVVTGALEGGDATEGWVEETITRAEGVPFYLVNFAQGLRSEAPELTHADLSGHRDAQTDTPWLVKATIRQRVTALPPAAQEALASMAIIGRVAPLVLLGATLSLSADAVVASLEAACRTQLLEEASGAAVTYQFTHDLIRETLLDSLSQARTILLHRRVGEALEHLPARERAHQAAAIADHFVAAGERARALPYLMLAGDQAEAVYAHAQAEDYHRAALEIARELGDRARAAEALEKLGNAVLRLARHRESAELWEQAMCAYQEMGDELGELRTLAGWLRAQAEVGREKLNKALAQARTILARIEPPDAAAITPALGSALAAAHNSLGWILWTSGLYADAQTELRQAVDLARAANDEAELALAQFRLLIAGGREQTAEAFEETLALAERSGKIEIVVTSHNMAAFMYEQAGDFARALAHQEQSVAAAEQRQDLRHLAWQLKNFSRFLFDYGDWPRMREVFARADAMMQEADRYYGETWQSSDMPIHRGMYALAEGREEEGRRLIEEVIERIAKGAPASYVLDPTCRLAEADLLAGNAEQARLRLTPLLSDLHTYHPSDEKNARGLLLLVLAWAEIALGRYEDAEARLAALLASATPLFRPDVLRVQGSFAMQQERWDVACEALDEALASARAMPYPYAELKALWVYGQLESAWGNPVAARERFEQALAICDRLGEGLYRPRIEQALKVLSL
jgi:predicted ATPase/DNA-binding XRE family transcriptional regulator